MKFNVELYNDGIPSKYGNAYDLTLDELVKELLYYTYLSDLYTEEELLKRFGNMSIGYTMMGIRWSEFKVTRTE